MKPIAFSLRLILLLGSAGLFAFILYLIKKGKLEVKYSIIWMFFSAAMLLIAIFPFIVLLLGDIAGVVDPVNFIFLTQIIFILLILLSVSAVISGFSQKIKKLAQKNAFLEQRVRELEKKIEK